MLEQDYISKILDLEDVIITKVENCADSLHFYIEIPVHEHILTDAGQRKVMDILPNRFEDDLIQYFKQFPNRTDVKFFVTDMSRFVQILSAQILTALAMNILGSCKQ